MNSGCDSQTIAHGVGEDAVPRHGLEYTYFIAIHMGLTCSNKHSGGPQVWEICITQAIQAAENSWEINLMLLIRTLIESKVVWTSAALSVWALIFCHVLLNSCRYPHRSENGKSIHMHFVQIISFKWIFMKLFKLCMLCGCPESCEVGIIPARSRTTNALSNHTECLQGQAKS